MVGSASRRGFRLIACVLLVIPCSAQIQQQSKTTPQTANPYANQYANQGAIKLNAELVVVDAQVIDKRSHEFIRGLKPQDFDLLEDDSKQRIEFFGQDQLPLSIVLLVDISPSVRPV